MKPKPKPVALGTLEILQWERWAEDEGSQRVGNRLSLVGNLKQDRFALVANSNVDGRIESSMVNRVPTEVGNHLPKTVCIPTAI